MGATFFGLEQSQHLVAAHRVELRKLAFQGLSRQLSEAPQPGTICRADTVDPLLPSFECDACQRDEPPAVRASVHAIRSGEKPGDEIRDAGLLRAWIVVTRYDPIDRRLQCAPVLEAQTEPTGGGLITLDQPLASPYLLRASRSAGYRLLKRERCSRYTSTHSDTGST